MSSTDLHVVMEYIGSRYTFTPEHYPILAQLDETQKLAFAVNHSAHHLSKSLGKISAECEAFDHDGELKREILEETTVKMFINILKLAQELGMNAADLCSKAPEFMKSK